MSAGDRNDDEPRRSEPGLGERVSDLAESVVDGMSSGAEMLAARAFGITGRVGRALLLRPGSTEMARQAGRSIQELRELAGLTQDELAAAAELADESLLGALEAGSATVSFELLLRLASILARNDPVPFVLRFIRTYNPEAWQILDGWGLGRLPLQAERERRFLNVYRQHDAARELSDESFERVLDFTRSAFELALHHATASPQPSDDDGGDDPA